jgi:hypothetical protein
VGLARRSPQGRATGGGDEDDKHDEDDKISDARREDVSEGLPRVAPVNRYVEALYRDTI